jgi:hypothetical protein
MTAISLIVMRNLPFGASTTVAPVDVKIPAILTVCHVFAPLFALSSTKSNGCVQALASHQPSCCLAVTLISSVPYCVGSGAANTVIVTVCVAVLAAGTPVTLTVTVLAAVAVRALALDTVITPDVGLIESPSGSGVAGSIVNVFAPVMFVSVAVATIVPLTSAPTASVVLTEVIVSAAGVPAETTRLKLPDVTPSMVTVSGYIPAVTAAVVFTIITVLPPVVADGVPSVTPDGAPFRVMDEPLAIFSVVTIYIAVPAVPAETLPICVPTETVLVKGGAGETTKLKGFDVTPLTVTVSGYVPAVTAADAFMVIVVLFDVVVVVVSVTPDGAPFSVIAEPLATLTVFNVNVALPPVPAVTMPVCCGATVMDTGKDVTVKLRGAVTLIPLFPVIISVPVYEFGVKAFLGRTLTVVIASGASVALPKGEVISKLELSPPERDAVKLVIGFKPVFFTVNTCGEMLLYPACTAANELLLGVIVAAKGALFTVNLSAADKVTFSSFVTVTESV